MNVVVLAVASRRGGALTIFRQFLDYLPNYVGNDKFYVFKDGDVQANTIEGVEFINDSNHSFKHRIWFDAFGLKKWCEKRGIVPDLVISFQNSASKLNCRQIVYYHQSLPFYPEKWNFFKKGERSLFFYKNIYPLFVKRTLSKRVDVVVQTESLRSMFAKCYNFDYKHTHAMFPDINTIDVDSIEAKQLPADKYNFIFPAIATKYKRHKTLVDAVALLRSEHFKEWEKIQVFFTFASDDYPELFTYIKSMNLESQFVFQGQLSYNELLSYYKAADGLLFPSTIETIGLPLLEAAFFGLPIVATDRMYAQDVLKGYDGVTFVDSFTPALWAEELRKICYRGKRFKAYGQKESSWPRFFDLIKSIK